MYRNNGFTAGDPMSYMHYGYPPFNGAYLPPMCRPKSFVKIAPRGADENEKHEAHPTRAENAAYGWFTLPMPVPILPPPRALQHHKPAGDAQMLANVDDSDRLAKNNRCIWDSYPNADPNWVCPVCEKKHDYDVWDEEAIATMEAVATAYDNRATGRALEMSDEEWMAILNDIDPTKV